MKNTDLVDLLGIRHPILNAPMGGGSAGPELAAAVTNAGGLGLLGLIAIPPPLIAPMIGRTRELTRGPFGAGVVLDNEAAPEQIRVCIEERVPLLVLFWGDPTPWVGPAHERGVRIAVQIGSVEEARAAAAAGVDVVIAQGVEAGGHVRGTTPLAELVPAVVEAVRPLPVVAAGGIADADDVAAALRLGAGGALLGTRFLASEEAAVDRRYKERVVAARASDTLLTTLFDIGWPGAPHRVLRNRVVREWESAGRPKSGERPGEGTIVGRFSMAGQVVEVPRYAVFPPMPGFEGDVDDACLYAGTSCERVRDVLPAAAIVEQLVGGRRGA